LKELVTGLPRDTLRTTIYSYHILPTLYNLTLVEYSRSLAKYGRILYVAVDGILPHIAAHCLYIATVGKTWQNIVEYGRIWQETRSSTVTRPMHNMAPINPATI